MSDLELLHAKLDDILVKLNHPDVAGRAAMGGKWIYLVERPHPWRRQLSIKGRNLTVGQLISTLRANSLSLEQLAGAVDLPLEAVSEALAYYERFRPLIELEAAEERSRLARKGYELEPTHLPR